MPEIVGRTGSVGLAVNAATTGETFGGTPGGYDYFRIKPGGFKLQPRQKKEVVEELGVDARDFVKGGLWYSYSCELFGSYSFREKIFHLWAGGAITTTGASAPYTHAIALSDKLLWGAAKVTYSDNSENANEIMQDVLTNLLVTGIQVKESPEGAQEMSFSGFCVTNTPSETVAALPTINESEIIKWDHLATSLNAITTQRTGDVSFDLKSKCVEGDFDHAATTPQTMAFSTREGKREVTWKVKHVEGRTTSAALCSDTDAEWTGANSFVWNNGGTTTAEREMSIIFGNSVVESADQDRLGWGRIRREISLRAMDAAAPRVIAIQFKNARATITT